MSRRGLHPLLMGLDKPKREPIEKKQVELSGYESAQRKRFLRSEAEAEETEQSKAACGWITPIDGIKRGAAGPPPSS